MVLMCSKKRVRARLAVLAAVQSWSRPSQTVWSVKASRFMAANIMARVCLPWPKLCSRWQPLDLRTLKLSFSMFPFGPGAGHDLGDGAARDGAARDGQRGHDSAAVSDVAPGVGDGDADPIDEHGVVGVAQGRALENQRKR